MSSYLRPTPIARSSRDRTACQNGAVPESFARRFAAVRSAQGPLAFGLDPSAELLTAWGLGDSADGLDRFADIVLEAAVGPVGLVKPQ